MDFEFANRIDNLQSKTEMVRSLESVLLVAIFHQDDFAISDFEWAFNLLETVTFEISEELKGLTETAFEYMRKERVESA